MVYVIQFHPDPARKLSPNLYGIYHCGVYIEKTPDDGQRNCPKHVEFYPKNKFEKLVHIVGFTIRMCIAEFCVFVSIKADYILTQNYTTDLCSKDAA